MCRVFSILFLMCLLPAAADAQSVGNAKSEESSLDAGTSKRPEGMAPNATLDPEDLEEYDRQPERVRRLVTRALTLTTLGLTYTYGSADPNRAGMDCSGTIFYLLNSQGFSEVPRSSPGQYLWVRKADQFWPVVGRKEDGVEFDQLLPGDLLFWSGTYAIEREVPVTHVMLYLGRERKTGRRVMFGASNGRSYLGKPRWGVSVFDFKLPSAKSKAAFLGYGRIPGLRKESGRAEGSPPSPDEG